jgi:hypothetical protein
MFFIAVLVVPLIALSLLWKKNLKTKYSIVLSTAAGEVEAIETTDRTTIQMTLSALKNAVHANTPVYR